MTNPLFVATFSGLSLSVTPGATSKEQAMAWRD